MIKMKGAKGLRGFIAAMVMMGIVSSLTAVPTSQKAKTKIRENQEYILGLSVAIKNFGTQAQKDEFGMIKNSYLTALSLFLEKRYVNSYKKNLETQQKLEKLYEQVSLDYIDRTSTMLGEIVKNFVDLKVRYDIKSDLLDRVRTNMVPEVDVKSYNPKEFHLFYDKYPILTNIKNGYGRLGDARRIRQEAIDLEKWFEEGKEIDPKYHLVRLVKYRGAIKLCRDAKLNVIRVYQLLNRNDIYTVQTELRDNHFAKEAKMPGVLDPRIPDDYKIDSSDSHMKVHREEVMIKVEGKWSEESQENTGTTDSSTTNPE